MRIGIASASPSMTAVLRRALALRSEHQILWAARDGARAIASCAKETPDLVLMDLMLPGIDGVQATRRIMASTPCAILIVTASVDANGGPIFDAMGHGAIDAVDAPLVGSEDLRITGASFLEKVDSIAKLVRTRRFIPTPDMFGDTWVIGRRERLLAIGASAGGPMAVACILGALPKEFPAAVVVIQHVDERFATGMADWLSRESALPVRPAAEGERLTQGVVLLARTNDHLILKSADRVGYTPEPREQPYRPSVDVFFESATRLWPGDVVGVLLTGMGRDGAKGLQAMRHKGHYTIAQDESSSAVYGMPKAAATLGAAVDILPLEAIAPRLVSVFSR
jgi:chemotaxis response regulator CheB